MASVVRLTPKRIAKNMAAYSSYQMSIAGSWQSCLQQLGLKQRIKFWLAWNGHEDDLIRDWFSETVLHKKFLEPACYGIFIILICF